MSNFGNVSTRASRDGHYYHEVYVVLQALELLKPQTTLQAISMEGLSEADSKESSGAADEVSDFVLYYAKEKLPEPSVSTADRTVIVQCKYAAVKERQLLKFGRSDALKTLQKFAQAFKDFEKQWGLAYIGEHLFFQLVTNRPIDMNLRLILQVFSNDNGKKTDSTAPRILKEAENLRHVLALTKEEAFVFSRQIVLSGSQENLSGIQSLLFNRLQQLTASDDQGLTKIRAQLQDLVRNKAGMAGAEGKNIIWAENVLSAIGVYDRDAWLPCPPHFSSVEKEKMVYRKQLPFFVDTMKSETPPLVLHAAGGIGKTVFMQQAAEKLAEDCEVVLFDCFAGGAFSMLEDGRHLPERGLLHIANELAFRGLCEPIVPAQVTAHQISHVFRQRLQYVAQHCGRVVLLLDAVDNSMSATGVGQCCFPVELLNSLAREPIKGVSLAVSCRTERKEAVEHKVSCRLQEMRLEAFNLEETACFVKSRRADAKSEEIAASFARTDGIARALACLLDWKSDWDKIQQSNEKILLEDIIKRRIHQAITVAQDKGTLSESELLLRCLSVLPPPISVHELTLLTGVSVSVLETFAAEMGYLLDRLPQGIMFRDEDGLHYVQQKYPCTEKVIDQLVSCLEKIQDESVYAARILPDFLLRAKRGERLFNLAKKGTLPYQLSSRTGQDSIRLLRLNAALKFAVRNGNVDQLVQLLVVRSRFAKNDAVGLRYLLNYPDLLAVTEDAELVRLLLEFKSIRPVEKHAGLAVYYFLIGQMKVAWLHAEETLRWWYVGKRSAVEGDVSCEAAVAFCFLMQGKSEKAIETLNESSWQTAQRMCCYAQKAVQAGILSVDVWAEAFCKATSPDVIAAGIPFFGFSRKDQILLCQVLAEKLKNTVEDKNDERGGDTNALRSVYQQAANVSLQLKLGRSTGVIAARAGRGCTFTRKQAENPQWFDFGIFFQIAVSTASSGKSIQFQAVVPQELKPLCKGLLRENNPAKFWEALSQRIFDRGQHSRITKVRRASDYFEFWSLSTLYDITKALSIFYGSRGRKKTEALIKIVSLWQAEAVDLLSEEKNEGTEFFRCFCRQTAVWVSQNLHGVANDAVVDWFQLVKREIKKPWQWLEIVRGLIGSQQCIEMVREAVCYAEQAMLDEAERICQSAFYGELARAVSAVNKEDAKRYFWLGRQRVDNQELSDMSYLESLQALMSKVKGRHLSTDAMLRASRLKEWEIPNNEPVDCLEYASYMDGVAAASGLRYVAELSRWDDKGIVPLACTMIPFVTSLLQYRKITPEEALVLSRLVMMADGEAHDVSAFVKALNQHPKFDTNATVELIDQFLLSYPGTMYRDALIRVIHVAKHYLDDSDFRLQYLVFLAGRDKESLEDEPLPGSEVDEFTEGERYSICINREKLFKRLKEVIQNYCFSDDLFDDIYIFKTIADEFETSLSEVGKTFAEILIEDNEFDQQLYLKCAECLLPVVGENVLQQALEWAFSEEIWWNDPEINWYVKAHIRLSDTFEEIGAGLLWRQLGALNAADRWRAAHSVRLAARFGQWAMIDQLVRRIGSSSAGAFQDKNHEFFYLHARLWLLIALARLAIDYPQEISRYQTVFRIILQNKSMPHVLLKHFAAQAVLACRDGGASLPETLIRIAAAADEPLPEHQVGREDAPLQWRRADATNQDEIWRRSYWDTNHRDMKKFRFDSDQFEYEWLDDLGRIFNLHYKEVQDRFTSVVQKLDHQVKGTFATDNRQEIWWLDERNIDPPETYGEQLAWHALMITAAELQQTIPTVLKTRTLSCYGAEGTPWQRWLSQFMLKYASGYWLADVNENVPEDIHDQLHQQSDKNYCTVKLDTAVIDQLLGDKISGSEGEHLVVRGNWWTEEDCVEVSVFSVLTSSDDALKLIKRVLKDDPETATLPDVETESTETGFNTGLCQPWIRCRKQSKALDMSDILGCAETMEFSVDTQRFAKKFQLTPDKMERCWKTENNQPVVRLSSWGSWEEERGLRFPFGTRLTCQTEWLRELLATEQRDLVLLIRTSVGVMAGDFSRQPCSLAVAHIDQYLHRTYYIGRKRGGYLKE